MAQVAVCSQINTKHINTVWAETVKNSTSPYFTHTVHENTLPINLKTEVIIYPYSLIIIIIIIIIIAIIIIISLLLLLSSSSSNFSLLGFSWETFTYPWIRNQQESAQWSYLQFKKFLTIEHVPRITDFLHLYVRIGMQVKSFLDCAVMTHAIYQSPITASW